MGHKTGSTTAPEVGHVTEATDGVESHEAGHVIRMYIIGQEVTERDVTSPEAGLLTERGVAGPEAILLISTTELTEGLGVILMREGVAGLGAHPRSDGMEGLEADLTAEDAATQGLSPGTEVEDSRGVGLEVVRGTKVKGRTLVVYRVVHTKTKQESAGSLVTPCYLL